MKSSIDVVVIYWFITLVIGIYSAFIYYGIYIYSLRAFKFGKIIAKYSDLLIDYDKKIEDFKNAGLKINNTLYKKYHITLIRPDMAPRNLFRLHPNGWLKFHLILENISDNKYNITVYCDTVSKYGLLLAISFLPFIFFFSIIPSYTHNYNHIINALVVFLIIFVPFLVISFIIQKLLCSRFNKKIENIILNCNQ